MNLISRIEILDEHNPIDVWRVPIIEYITWTQDALYVSIFKYLSRRRFNLGEQELKLVTFHEKSQNSENLLPKQNLFLNVKNQMEGKRVRK